MPCLHYRPGLKSIVSFVLSDDETINTLSDLPVPIFVHINTKYHPLSVRESDIQALALKDRCLPI